ncbi:MAG: DUF4931 domain-containing protein [Syntrophorhabdaceae bacterium]|nr:DUF4931 domain-containing protein [Syntrophorhabdaceae bacterium]
MAELRRDPVSGNWIITEYTYDKTGSAGICPFCPGNEHLTPKSIFEYKDPDGQWQIRCFPAKNSIFVIEAKENKRAEGIYDKMGNVGAHEIIVENRSHTKTLSNFTENELYLLLNTYKERISDLKKDKRFKHIQAFKNHGELAGSYIFHPHSHILATPILPHRIELELQNTKSHYMQKERCLLCDILNQELRNQKRLVSINSDFIALCPFASRFPFEVWIIPRKHDDRFENTRSDTIKQSLVPIMLDIMKRIEKLTNSYAIALHTSPNTDGKSYHDEGVSISTYYHWHIEILPMDFRTSRYKKEDEFYVVPFTPEEAAKALREQSI